MTTSNEGQPESNFNNVIPIAPRLEEAERERRREEAPVPSLENFDVENRTVPIDRTKSDSFEHFQTIVSRLGLTRDDMRKVTLDVGAGLADYATWAKEIYENDQVYSLDKDVGGITARGRVVKGDAEKLPFKDDSFELVISVASVPFMHLTELLAKYGANPIEKDVEMMTDRVASVISEMIRVVKPGGEIRFTPGPASADNPVDLENYTLEGIRLMHRVFHGALERVQKSQKVQFYFEPNELTIDGEVIQSGYFRIVNLPPIQRPEFGERKPGSVEKFLTAVEDWFTKKLKEGGQNS